jgi:hypothetical protein
MAELKALDLTQLRTELVRQSAPWRSVDTTIAMLEEQDRRRLLGVPTPPKTEADRIIQQAEAIQAVSGGNGRAGTPRSPPSRRTCRRRRRSRS